MIIPLVITNLPFLCMLAFVFVALQFHCFLRIVDVFLSVLVCNLDLFSLYRFITFEQRNTILLPLLMLYCVWQLYFKEKT